MFFDEIKHLLNSRVPGIWIQTTEEKEVLVGMRNVFEELREYEDVYVWSMTGGINQLVDGASTLSFKEISKNQGLSDLQKLLNQSNDKSLRKSRAWVLRDYHLVTSNPQALRIIRDLKENPTEKYTPIIIISPTSDIPVEFKSIFKLVVYGTPSIEDIAEIVSGWAISYNQDAEEEEIQYLAKRLNGFTRSEIINLLNLSYEKHGSFDLDMINQKRIAAINESGVLDYKVPTAKLEDMGGNDNFKEWIEVVEVCMSEEAEEYGIPKPKGYLSIGIPGTSKSYSAEALAASWEIPLIKMNMAKINSRFAGDTERNMYKALSLVKASAPCVLLIDEVEKALGGKKRDRIVWL